MDGKGLFRQSITHFEPQNRKRLYYNADFFAHDFFRTVLKKNSPFLKIAIYNRVYVTTNKITLLDMKNLSEKCLERKLQIQFYPPRKKILTLKVIKVDSVQFPFHGLS